MVGAQDDVKGKYLEWEISVGPPINVVTLSSKGLHRASLSPFRALSTQWPLPLLQASSFASSPPSYLSSYVSRVTQSNTSHPHTQVSVSAPTWNSVYFLRASNGGASYHFGVFGYTGSQTHLGYRFPISYVFYHVDPGKSMLTNPQDRSIFLRHYT